MTEWPIIDCLNTIYFLSTPGSILADLVLCLSYLPGLLEGKKPEMCGIPLRMYLWSSVLLTADDKVSRIH